MTSSTGVPDTVEGLSIKIRENGHSLVVAVPSRLIASQLVTEFYRHESSEWHVEHFPKTDDENGCVEHHLVIFRHLSYCPDNGWFSSDVESTVDIEITEDSLEELPDEVFPPPREEVRISESKLREWYNRLGGDNITESLVGSSSTGQKALQAAEEIRERLKA